MPAGFRIEHDSMGEVRVPEHALYGPQTQRAVENFPISGLRFPRSFIRALGLIKAASAKVNRELNELSPENFRGTFPGLAYQLGNFAAAYAAQQQAWLADHFRSPTGQPNYALTMALVEAVVFLVIILLAAIGREERGKEF